MNISRTAKVDDRIEIRLTGLDKGRSEDLYVWLSAMLAAVAASTSSPPSPRPQEAL